MSFGLALALALSLVGPSEDARAAYKKGETAYEVSQYAEALEHFHGAYAAAKNIEDAELRNRVLVTLYFNLARTHIKVFKIDGDHSHLPKALDLLEKYEAATADAESAAAATRLREEIDSLEPAEADTEPEPKPAIDEPAPPPATTAAPDDEDAASDPDEPDTGEAPNRPLLIGGIAAMGAGVVGLGVMGGGMGMGAAADRGLADGSLDDDVALKRGRTGNGMTVAGAVVGGVGLAVGATLVVLATRKRAGTGTTARVSPWFAVESAGVAVGGRF